MGIRFGEKIQVVPAFAPAVSTADSNESVFIGLENAQWVTFLYQAGALTTSDDETITVKVVSGSTNSTGAGDTDQSGSWWYRLSSALGTDAWGAITAGTTAGVSLTGESDNMSLLIDIDPAAVQALDADATYVYLDFGTPTIVTGWGSACAFIEPRYPQNTQISSTTV